MYDAHSENACIGFGGTLDATSLLALSPLDGRYARKAAPLREYLSEYALIRYRTLIEVRWLQHLADEPSVVELASLEPPIKDVLNQIVDEFSVDDATRIKALEAKTNHDVKAVEYYLQQKLEGVAVQAGNLTSFIHFACTSEDINNLSYALMLRDARQRVLLPAMRDLTNELRELAHRFADVPMLARTHGQPATPTTLGKEIANFVYRLQRQTELFAAVGIHGKFNGAVGNHNAHVAAYPDADWIAITDRFLASLGLSTTRYTTQIEPHDWIAEYCQGAVALQHRARRSMPRLLELHQLGLLPLAAGRGRGRLVDDAAQSEPDRLRERRRQSRARERAARVPRGEAADLALAARPDRLDRAAQRRRRARPHADRARSGRQRAWASSTPTSPTIAADLADRWEVLAEAVQTVMRRYGLPDAYEQLKELTRGRAIDAEALREFIGGLPLPAAERKRLLALDPSSYTGLAAELARRI